MTSLQAGGTYLKGRDKPENTPGNTLHESAMDDIRVRAFAPVMSNDSAMQTDLVPAQGEYGFDVNI